MRCYLLEPFESGETLSFGEVLGGVILFVQQLKKADVPWRIPGAHYLSRSVDRGDPRAAVLTTKQIILAHVDYLPSFALSLENQQILEIKDRFLPAFVCELDELAGFVL